MGLDIPRHWRLKEQRYRLMGEICENGHKVFPPRDVCPDCRGEAKVPYAFSGKGTVYSYTTIYEAPAGFEQQAPYIEAIIELEEGPRLTAQLTDLPFHTEVRTIDGEEREVRVYDIAIDDEVEMVTRKLNEHGNNGLINYGYKFRPRLSASSSSK